jgi:O-antigen ligase
MDNNCVAIAMVAGVGLAFFLGINAPNWWQKGLGLGAALLMGHAVLFSFSRGGMLALIITGVIGFVLLPKQPKHYLIFALAVAIGFRLAGDEVSQRFSTSFATEAERDSSAQSRLDMWRDCCDVMLKNPLFGVGPRHWPLIAHLYGWSVGKEAHSLWLQVGAEVGFVGLGLLLLFYGLTIVRLWPLMRTSSLVPDPWIRDVARMVIASGIGFMIASQFVSLVGLELPYYVVLLGAGALKLTSLALRDGASVPFSESTYEPIALDRTPTTV